MSEMILRLIPTSPIYIPDDQEQQFALDILRSSLSLECKITIIVTDDVQFVDAGSELESVMCPVCSTFLNMNWWSSTMDQIFESSKFEDLTIVTPCCRSEISLNDLHYIKPVGFSRFIIEISNESCDIDDSIVYLLENALKCKLKKIQAHY